MSKAIKFRHILDNESGTTLVEAAVGLIPFSLLLFGMLQVLSFAHTTMSMHYALSKAARWGILNQTSAGLNRVDSIKQRFQVTAPRYGIAPDGVTLRVCPATVPDCVVESAGGAGRPFIIHAEQAPRFLPSFGLLNPRTSVLINNEPQIGT